MFTLTDRPDKEKYIKLFENMLYGFVYLKMVYDEQANPTDCIFLEVNKSYYEVMDLTSEKVLGKKLTEVIPIVKNSKFDWIGTFGKVASTGESIAFEQYLGSLDKWVEFSAFSDREGYLGLTIHEITKEKNYLESLKFLNNSLIKYTQFTPSHVNYRMITDDVLKLSEAKFTFIAMLNEENDQVTIEDVSCDNDTILKAGTLLGFNPVGSKWKVDDEYLRDLRTQKIAVRPIEDKIFTSVIRLPILRRLKEVFSPGDLWHLGLFYHEELLGSVFMIMPPGKAPANPELIELFSQQISMFLLRLKAEQELEQTKERLQFALEGSGDGIWDWNLHTSEEMYSESYKKILGYGDNEPWSSSYYEWKNRIHPDDLGPVMENLKEYLDGKIKHYYTEHRLRCKDGSYKWTLSRGKITGWSSDGKPLRMVGTIKDVSESKKSEEELRKAKEEAEKLSHEKSEYIANMSHELRTPLNVILGAVQLLDLYLKSDSGFDKEKAKKHLKSMNQNCLRLLRLINNLIDTTKIDAGFYQIELMNQNIVNIIEGIVASVLEYSQQKDISLTFDTDVKEKVIACDVDMIERVILNLLSNAFKFTNPGGTISVSIHDMKDYVLVSIKDNGIGIPKDKQGIIFERYKQVDKLLTREHEGSGIGLSLARSLVGMHGGRLSVKSEYGKGSEFVIELPARTLSNDEQQAETSYVPNNHRLVERMNVEFADIYK